MSQPSQSTTTTKSLHSTLADTRVDSRDDGLFVKTPPATSNPLIANLLVTAVVAIGTLTLPATLYRGDPFAWQSEAQSIILRGEFNVPKSIAGIAGEPGQFFVLNHRNGKYYSKYGTLNGILNVLPVLIGRLIGDNILSLGLFAVVLSATIAYVLYDLTGYYTRAEWVRVAFVLLCFYTTYAWNYLRCTNSEATQWLFFLLAARSVIRLNRAPKEEPFQFRSVAFLWLWTACLCLTKISWVLLVPLLAGALIYLARRNRIPRPRWPGFSWRAIILPAMLICMVVAINNWAKFGAPWLTGYHQWHDSDPRIDFLAAFRDLILSPQWSFLICFPPLLLALPAWKRFWREHKEEGVFILAVFVVFLLLNILRGNWRGDWCYGPRYFLFILPFLALPAVYMLEWAGQHIRRRTGYLTISTVLAASLFFVIVQWQVIRMDWFFKYQVQGDLVYVNDPKLHEYFEHTHFAKINWDYWQARNDLTKIPYYDRIRQGLSPDQMENFRSNTQNYLSHPNLYWW
jgi:hypothetical protein